MQKVRAFFVIITLLSLSVATNGEKDKDESKTIHKQKRLKARGCKRSKCRLDDSEFGDFVEADVIDVQLTEGGPDKVFRRSKGDKRRLWNGDSGSSTMNLITRPRTGPGGKDLVYGSITDGDTVYQIAPDEFGNPEATAIPSALFPPEGDLFEVPHAFKDEKNIFRTASGYHRNSTENLTLSSKGHRELSRAIAEIDVMVVWTRRAECMNSDKPQGCILTPQTEEKMRGLIDLAIAESNTAYELSGVFIVLRLVHAFRTSHVETTYDETLTALIRPDDGIMDDVHTKREQYGADVVNLIMEEPSFCGKAGLGPTKEGIFSTTKASCATGYYSFVHEISHTMGLLHDRGTHNACGGNGYNYGWRDGSSNFRSIMGLGCRSDQCDQNPSTGPCTRVQRFSNVENLYNGRPIGDANSNNARRLNEVRWIVSEYFPSKVAPSPLQIPAPTTSLRAPTSMPKSLPTKPPAEPENYIGLKTTLDANNGQAGNMFDIVAKKDVEITGFDIHTKSRGMVVAIVYTRVGSYEGFGTNENAWRKIQEVDVSGQGEGNPTFLPTFSSSVKVPGGATQSFYVTLTSPDIRYTRGIQEGRVYVENGDLQFLEGCALTYAFGSVFPNRIFNGVIRYRHDQMSNRPVPTPSPTILPLPPPTRRPLPSPTPLPTTVPLPTRRPLPSTTSKPTTALTPIKAPERPERKVNFLTTMEATSALDGSMFDIVAKNNIKIRGFNIHTRATTSVHAYVYTKMGSYRGSHRNRKNEWLLMQEVHVTGKGEGSKTVLPSFESPVEVAAGSTQAFYVTLTTPDGILLKTGTEEGRVFAQNEDIFFLEGIGVAYEFGRMFTPRVFNGVVRYRKAKDGFKKCRNDITWLLKKKNGKTSTKKGMAFNCDWVAAKREKRCKRKGIDTSTGFQSCPLSCGTC